jgi:hypothetical protein
MIIKPKSRVTFDISNDQHVQCFKQYVIKNKWEDGCPFALEYPWMSVPDMIKDKLIRSFLDIKE